MELMMEYYNRLHQNCSWRVAETQRKVHSQLIEGLIIRDKWPNKSSVAKTFNQDIISPSTHF